MKDRKQLGLEISARTDGVRCISSTPPTSRDLRRGATPPYILRRRVLIIPQRTLPGVHEKSQVVALAGITSMFAATCRYSRVGCPIPSEAHLPSQSCIVFASPKVALHVLLILLPNQSRVARRWCSRWKCLLIIPREAGDVCERGICLYMEGFKRLCLENDIGVLE
jgi:hypothetical protein